MSEHISRREHRNDGGRIMRTLDEGRSIIITRRSEPVGEFRPLRRRRYVDRSAPTRIDREAFYRYLDEATDQSFDPRG